jgi:hypothetical protein
LQFLELIRKPALQLFGRLLFGFRQALFEFGLDFLVDRLAAFGDLSFLVLQGFALFFDLGFALFDIRFLTS